MKEMKVMIVVKVVKDIHRLALGYALAITALALTASAWAQSSLVLYGVADVGIEYLSHAEAILVRALPLASACERYSMPTSATP